jgi:hypothetical protein
MVDTRKKKSKRRFTRKLFKDIKPIQHYSSFIKNTDILQKIFKRYPKLFTSYSFYKGIGFKGVNYLMRENQIDMNLDDQLNDTIPSSDSKVNKLYNESLTIFKKNHSNHFYGVYCKILESLTHIFNFRELFRLYKPYRSSENSVVYRGIIDTQSISTMKKERVLLQRRNTIEIPYFQSCTRSYQTAISFQECGIYGPCCLYILYLSKDVLYLPLFWTVDATWSPEGSLSYQKLSEGYNHSEFEILIEPYVNYKLRKTYKKEFNISELKVCPYDVSDKIELQVFEIDVLPPHRNAYERITELYKTVKKGYTAMKSHIQEKSIIDIIV